MDTRKINSLAPALLAWFSTNARDLPWRRTRDPYAIWVSEIMLQQTQVQTVIPYWNRWLRELPDIAAAARAHPDTLHKLWEGLGYYTRVRNLQRAAQMIVAQHGGVFPQRHENILALPGIGRYTAGAIGSIAFNQPVPILDGNVIRVLTRLFGIADNPKDKTANARLWELAQQLVTRAQTLERPPVAAVYDRRPCERSDGHRPPLQDACSHLNQSLMELGALVCTPRNPRCNVCPVQKLCVAFREQRVAELPNLAKRAAATARHFVAFVAVCRGRLLVRQRPAGGVNAHLWEFPNVETTGDEAEIAPAARELLGAEPEQLVPLATVKHAITRYRITLTAFLVTLKKPPAGVTGVWQTPAQVRALALTAAHKRLATAAAKSILSGR